MIVRRAILEDSKAIAAIHVHSWQAAYQGIIPDEFLRALSVDQREGVWREILKGGASDTWVLEVQGEILGWASLGRSRDSDAPASTGELWAIYVDPRHWRRGLGQLLWNEAERQLRHSGFSEVTLWVLKDNVRALAFYHSNGFAIDPGIEKVIERGGTQLVEIRLRKALGG